jgi:hypothetical protein
MTKVKEENDPMAERTVRIRKAGSFFVSAKARHTGLCAGLFY